MVWTKFDNSVLENLISSLQKDGLSHLTGCNLDKSFPPSLAALPEYSYRRDVISKTIKRYQKLARFWHLSVFILKILTILDFNRDYVIIL